MGAVQVGLTGVPLVSIGAFSRRASQDTVVESLEQIVVACRASFVSRPLEICVLSRIPLKSMAILQAIMLDWAGKISVGSGGTAVPGCSLAALWLLIASLL